MAKAQGLDATNYRAWISQDIMIDETLRKLFELFVLGTPSFGLSKKGRDLYTYYLFNKTEEYETLVANMTYGITEVCFAETYEELKNVMLTHQWIGFQELPQGLSEAIYVYVGNLSGNDFIREYFPETGDQKGKTNEQKKQDANKRKKILYAERIFYHLRNAFAHGSYSIQNSAGGEYLILQDERRGYISARLVLKCSTLIRWHQILSKNKIEKEG